MGNPNIIEIKNDESIRRATAVKLDEGLRPRRVVLRELPGKFVTHWELMRVDIETRKEGDYTYDYVVCSHEGYDQGHYFEWHNVSKDEAWKQAVADFVERSQRF